MRKSCGSSPYYSRPSSSPTPMRTRWIFVNLQQRQGSASSWEPRQTLTDSATLEGVGSSSGRRMVAASQRNRFARVLFCSCAWHPA